MAIRVEVFDVEGAIINDAKTGRSVNRLSENQQNEINRRISVAKDELFDVKALVLEEPGLSRGGKVQVTLTFVSKSKQGGEK